MNGPLKYVVRKFFVLKKMNTTANLLPFHVKWCPGGQAPQTENLVKGLVPPFNADISLKLARLCVNYEADLVTHWLVFFFAKFL